MTITTRLPELVRLHQTPIRQFLRRLTGDDREQPTIWHRRRSGAPTSTCRPSRRAGVCSAGCFASRFSCSSATGAVNALRQSRYPRPAGAGDEAQSAIDWRTVDQLMMRLAPDERAAVLLHYQHGMSHPGLPRPWQCRSARSRRRFAARASACRRRSADGKGIMNEPAERVRRHAVEVRAGHGTPRGRGVHTRRDGRDRSPEAPTPCAADGGLGQCGRDCVRHVPKCSSSMGGRSRQHRWPR